MTKSSTRVCGRPGTTRQDGADRRARVLVQGSVRVCRIAAVAAILVIAAAGCGSAAHRVAIPATARMPMGQAAERLCAAGLRVRIEETSIRGPASGPGAAKYVASPALTSPQVRVIALGTTPPAGTPVAPRSVVVLKAAAPYGTFSVIRLPRGCQASSGPATGTTG